MSVSNLRELILFELLSLPVSFSQNTTLGANASLRPSTLYLIRKMLETIDSVNQNNPEEVAQAQKLNKERISQLLQFTKNLVDFCGYLKKNVIEPADPTRVNYDARGALDDYYIDFDHFNLFIELTSDFAEDDYVSKYASGYNLFALTKKQLLEIHSIEALVRGENGKQNRQEVQVRVFENILKAIGINPEELADGETVNLIEEINKFYAPAGVLKKEADKEKKMDPVARESMEIIGRALKRDINNLASVLNEQEGKENDRYTADVSINEKMKRNIRKFLNKLGKTFTLEVTKEDINNGKMANVIALLKSKGISIDESAETVDLSQAIKEYINIDNMNTPTFKLRVLEINVALERDNRVLKDEDKKLSQSARLMLANMSYLQEHWGTSLATRLANYIKLTYIRYGKELFGFDFWNITTTKQKVGFWVLTSLLGALTIGAFAFTPLGTGILASIGINLVLHSGIAALAGIFSYNFAMTFAVLTLILPKMLVGKADNKGMKKSMINMSMVFAGYYGGLLGAFFVRGLSIAFFAANPIFSAITVIISFVVWLSIGLPTFSSLWHLMIGTRANKAEKNINKTKTYQKTETRLALQKLGTASIVLGLLSISGTFLGLGLAIAPIIAIVFGIGLIAASYANLGNFSKAKNFGKMAKSYFDEYSAMDEESLVMGYQSFRNYMSENIEYLKNDFLLSSEEYEQWKKLINGDENVDITNLMPRDKKGQRVIKSFFEALGQQKAEVPSWEQMPSISEHVQSYTEIAMWTKFKFLDPTNFHLGATPFSYIAAKLSKSRWANALESIVAIENSDKYKNLSQEEQDKLSKLLDTLKNIKENSDVPSIRELGLETKEAKDVYLDIMNVVAKFTDSVMGSQKATMESEHRNRLELHKKLAYDLGDMRYNRLVGKISLQYGSLVLAERAISAKAEKDRTDDEKYWLGRYQNFYKARVSQKYNAFFSDPSIWGKHDLIKKYLKQIRQLSLDDMNMDEDLLKEKIKRILSEQDEYKKLSDEDLNKLVEEFYSIGTHAITLLILGDIYDVEINMYESGKDQIGLMGNKNAQLGMNLHKFSGVLMERDALNATAIGHETFFLNAVVDFEQGRKDGLLYTNLPMLAQGSNVEGDDGKPLFPIGDAYGSAVTDWTQYVGAAYDDMLTYYGKGITSARGEGLVTWTNPGEDSVAYYMNRYAQAIGKQRTDKQVHSKNIAYYVIEWVRMTTTNLVGTEARYSSNVTRMLSDFVSKIYAKSHSAGFDWKMSNIMMALHYVNAFVTVVFVLALPIAVIFSSFAFLMPFLISFAISSLLMLGINLTRFHHEARERGDFFVASKDILKKLVKNFPFWVAIQPVILLFGVNAANEVYKFLNTYKEMRLSDNNNVEQRYKNFGHITAKIGTIGYMLTGLYVFLILVFTLSNPVTWGIGAGAAVIGVFKAVLVALPYILASSAYINGLNAYPAGLDKNGNISTTRVWGAVFKNAFINIVNGIPMMFRFIGDLNSKLQGKEAKGLKKLEENFKKKEEVVRNTDISLKQLSNLMKSDSENKIVKLLEEKGISKENVEKALNDETLTGSVMAEVATTLQNAINSGDLTYEEVAKTLQLDIKETYDYSFKEAYKENLDKATDFLSKRPILRTMLLSITRGAVITSVVTIIATAILSSKLSVVLFGITLSISSIAWIGFAVFAIVAALPIGFKIGEHLAKKNVSKAVLAFSGITGAFAATNIGKILLGSFSLEPISAFISMMVPGAITGFVYQKLFKAPRITRQIESILNGLSESEEVRIFVVENAEDTDLEQKLYDMLLATEQFTTIKNLLPELYNGIQVSADSRVTVILNALAKQVVDKVLQDGSKSQKTEISEFEKAISEAETRFPDIRETVAKVEKELLDKKVVSFGFAQTSSDIMLVADILHKKYGEDKLEIIVDGDAIYYNEQKQAADTGKIIFIMHDDGISEEKLTELVAQDKENDLKTVEQKKEQARLNEIAEIHRQEQAAAEAAFAQAEANRKAEEARKAAEQQSQVQIEADAKVNIFDEQAVNALIEKLIQEFGQNWSEASKSIFRRTRFEYVEQLKAKAKGEKTTQLVIGENFTPLAELNAKDLLTANVRQLADLLSNEGYLSQARKVVVDICLMNGGIGSSIKRDNLIAAVQLFNREMALATNIADPKERAARIAELQESLDKLTFLDRDLSKESVKYGAKADDLFFVVKDKDGKPQLKSIMNIKLDKILADKASGTYKDIKMVMLVSPESRELVQQLYDNNPQMQQALDATMAQQDMYPVVQYDEKTGEINFLVSETSPKAPGGHGVWLATLMDRIVKKDLGKSSSISVIGNSDALASGPIAGLVGYMSKENVGMTIVSVDRENIDRKGGVFGLLSRDIVGADGKVIETIKVPTILELAQAKAAGQAGVFEELGFRAGDGAQPFNSNTVFVNDSVMQKLYNGLMGIYQAQGMTQVQAQAEFDKLMLPDLITNAKEKNGISYVQLEGALGSSVLNMNAKLEVLRRQNADVNKLMNSILGRNKPLVQIVNANKELRNSVFTPVKFATDFWIQFTNGVIENDTWVSLSPKGHGAVNVVATNKNKKTQYTDVSYFLQYWRNADIRELNNLVVEGDDVKMSDVVLKGDVTIRNDSASEVMISPETLATRFTPVNGRVVLENVTITVTSDGKMIVEKDGVVILEKKTSEKIVEETEKIKTAGKKVAEDRVRAQTERLKELQDKLGIEFGTLKYALEMLQAQENAKNRAALKEAIVKANEKGIDIKSDSLYKEKLDVLLSAVIKDHSYKGEKGYYWDEQAREIFKNQRTEFIERQIAGSSEGLNIGQNFFLPPIANRTGMTSQSLMDRMGITNLSSILANGSYRRAAKRAHFVDAQMNGGIGSSVERLSWLKAKKVYEAMQSVRSVDEMQKILESMNFLDLDDDINAQQAALSAKGSDLYFRVNVGTEQKPKYELLSITDVKLSSLLEKKSQYKSVSVVMLTSPTSEDIVEDLYQQSSRSDAKKNNRQAINGNGQNVLEVFGDKDIAEFARISQATYPSVKMDGDTFSLAFDKEAPGGHGVWLKTLLGKIRNVDQAIVCISNSDAVNSGTPVEVSGYMLRENKGVVVLVATREDIDRKGGIVGLKKVVLDNGKEIFVPSIMELAQAKNNPDNAAMFTEMGFAQYEGTVPFNTNTVLINAGLFHNFLQELKGLLSEEEFATLMSPDLIVNKKDGYIQLEGALGSSVFNMNERLEIMRNTGNAKVDALLKKYFPNGMVGLVLADKSERTKIFTPFKFAVDFWIQFTSGKINPKSFVWEVARKEAVNIAAPVKAKVLETGKEKSTVYADVYYLLRYWRNCNIDSLLNLYINDGLKDGKEAGIVKMKNITLKGNVTLNNDTKEELLLRPDLVRVCGFAADENGNTVLENVKIEAYEQDGQIMLKVTNLADGEEKVYPTRLVNIDEFNQNRMYIVPFEAGSQVLPSTTVSSETPASIAGAQAPVAANATANPTPYIQKGILSFANFNEKGEPVLLKFEKGKGVFRGYKKIAPIPVQFIKQADGSILKGENGHPLTLKFSALANEQGQIVFRTIGTSTDRFEKLSAEDQALVFKTAIELFKYRLANDNVALGKLSNVLNKSSNQIETDLDLKLYKEDKGIVKAKKNLKDLKYDEKEIERLLPSTSMSYTYAGIKDTVLKVTSKLDVFSRAQTLKKAGITKVVLTKAANIKTYSQELIDSVSEQGLHPIISIDENTSLEDVTRYAQIKSVNGFRVMKDNARLDEILNIILESGKELSYKLDDLSLNAIQSLENRVNGKVIFVVNAEACAATDETLKTKLQQLASEGRISLYFETDKEVTQDMMNIINDIFGKGIDAAKTMISVGKTYVSNGFAILFKKDVATLNLSEGLETEYKDVFAAMPAQTVASTLKELLSGNVSYDAFVADYNSGKLSAIMTDELDIKIKSVLEDEMTNDEKVTALRQFVLGVLITFVENNIDVISGDIEVDVASMKVEDKNQLIYRVIQLLAAGQSIEKISETVQQLELNKDMSLGQLVANITDSSKSKAIAEQWNKTDMTVSLLKASEVMENMEDIKALLTDNIKPLNIMQESFAFSTTQIKGILAAA